MHFFDGHPIFFAIDYLPPYESVVGLLIETKALRGGRRPVAKANNYKNNSNCLTKLPTKADVHQ
jgi:hypothetical protein